MLLAGTDTSSVTMFYLLKACQDDPSLEQCLREEVATHIGKNLSSRCKTVCSSKCMLSDCNFALSRVWIACICKVCDVLAAQTLLAGCLMAGSKPSTRVRVQYIYYKSCLPTGHQPMDLDLLVKPKPHKSPWWLCISSRHTSPGTHRRRIRMWRYTANIEGRFAGGREVCHGDLVHLEKITAALNESMRFKPVGPVAIRQATKELSIPPATLNGCPFGLNFKRGDSAIVHLEGKSPTLFVPISPESVHPHMLF